MAKTNNTFRSYDDAPDHVKSHYLDMRKNQTYDYVGKMLNKFETREPRKMKVEDAIRLLDQFNDASDPDTALPNVQHLFQTAERARNKKEERWMVLVSLIHDLGKMLYFWNDSSLGCSIEKQWGVTGDTFMVGCQLQDSLIYPEYNLENPDMKDPILGTILGLYQKECGLDQMRCAWGHDEYLYRVLSDPRNKDLHKLPEEGLRIIRYHSFYPWHNAGGYQEFENKKDQETKVLVQRFNDYDLYSKSDDNQLNVDQLLDEYYRDLILEFFPKSYLYF